MVLGYIRVGYSEPPVTIILDQFINKSREWFDEYVFHYKKPPRPSIMMNSFQIKLFKFRNENCIAEKQNTAMSLFCPIC